MDTNPRLNDSAVLRTFYLRSSGSYENGTRGGQLQLGRRSSHIDPSF